MQFNAVESRAEHISHRPGPQGKTVRRGIPDCRWYARCQTIRAQQRSVYLAQPQGDCVVKSYVVICSTKLLITIIMIMISVVFLCSSCACAVLVLIPPHGECELSWSQKKKICVFTVRRPTLIFGPTLNFFMALLVENYLKALFLPSNVVFDV